MQIQSQNAKETKKIGQLLAKEILLSKKGKIAKVLALEGELGSGKTIFLQGFAKGLGVKQKILSPTFVIQKSFKIKNKEFKRFYHIDCYRVQKQKEILDLGFRDITKVGENIIAIEWAERIKKILPKQVIKLRFEFIDKNKRNILINGKK